MRILFFAVGLLWAGSLFAQEKIDTDRPDQTESPFTVPKGYFQAEFGFTKLNLKNSDYQLEHPTSLLKYGLNKKLELRLESTLKTEYEQIATEKRSFVTMDPVEIGFKLGLLEEKGLLPKLSLIAHAGLPFLASKHARPDRIPFIIRMSMQNSLTNSAALGYNVGFEQDGSGLGSWFYTLAPGFEIGEKWYAYVEVFGSVQKNELPDHALDCGIAFFVSNDVKLDLSGGIGLSPESFKNYIALGFSFRLPFKR